MKKIIKINSDKAELTHLLGDTEDRLLTYGHYKCPEHILRDVWANHQDKSKKSENFLLRILNNPACPLDLYMDIKKYFDTNKISYYSGHNVLAPESNFKSFLEEKINIAISPYFYHLSKKIPELELLIKKSGVISGGFVTSWIHYFSTREHIKTYDVDIFFKNKEDIKAVIKKIVPLLNDSFREKGSIPLSTIQNNLEFEDFENGFNIKNINKNDLVVADLNGLEVVISSNAITIRKNREQDLQLIFRRIGSAEEITQSFDFAHTMAYYDISEGNFSVKPETIYSILNKELIFKGGLSPINSFARFIKFSKNGWSFSKKEIVKAAFWCSQKIDFTNKEQLVESLRDFYSVGVNNPAINTLLSQKEIDIEYFMELMEDL